MANHCYSLTAIRQIGFTHPFGKLADFEDATHDLVGPAKLLQPA